MFRSIVTAAAALCLVACAPGVSTNPPGNAGGASVGASVVDRASEAVVRADAAVDRASAAYDVIRMVSDRVLPYLSPARAARVRAIQALADAAFERARVTSDLAVQAAELAKAAAAARQLESLTVDPD